MLHPLLVEDLANLPPEDWSKTLQRFEWLAQTHGHPLNRAELADGAQYLAVSERYLRKLLNAHAARLSGGVSKFPNTGFQRSIDEESEIAIASAIARAKPSDTEAMVYKEATRLAAVYGAVISRTAVRTRFGKSKSAIDLSARFGCQAKTFVDVCGLSLNVELPRGATSTVVLATTIRGADGFVGAFSLFSYADLAAGDKLLADHVKFALEEEAFVQLTSYLEKLWSSSILNSSNAPTLQGTRSKRTVRSGMPIRATFGRKIGRIMTRVADSTWAQLASSPPVPLETAITVLRYLIDRHNAGVRTPENEETLRSNGRLPATFAPR